MHAQTFGPFIEPTAVDDYLKLTFSAVHLPMQGRWINNSLSANFIATYCGAFFPEHDPSLRWTRKELCEIMTYLVNELLDNALKYGMTATTITLDVYLRRDGVRVYVVNPIVPRAALAFQEYIQVLLTHDPADLYFQQMEWNASGDSRVSRLGLLSMLHDYHAQLAWKFEGTSPGESVLVTTMVQMLLQRCSEGVRT